MGRTRRQIPQQSFSRVGRKDLGEIQTPPLRPTSDEEMSLQFCTLESADMGVTYR